MTTAEACSRFKLDKKELQKRIKEDMVLGIHKEGRFLVIPDETKIIPSKTNIMSFLFQIVKYKNNPSTTVSRALCPTDDGLRAVMEYLYKRGFIGTYEFSPYIPDLFASATLTDEGLTYMLGKTTSEKLNGDITNYINLNLNLSVVNI